MIPDFYKVSLVRQETHDTFTLELEGQDGQPPMSFEPGQFNMLYVFGVGEVPISISSGPGRKMPLTHTTREVGTVTKAMRKLKRGDVLGVRGPFGSHWPVEHAGNGDVIIVAGGIGLAPLRPALYELLSRRNHYGRIVLLYGTRSPDDILYLDELKHWRSQFDLEIHVTVDRAVGSWRGNVGLVTSLIPKAPFDPTGAMALVCGPEVMMRFTVQELRRRGVSPSRIYVSMERNMKCGMGFCGHCQHGPHFVCKDGPVFQFDEIEELFGKREI
ncbi:MAG: FAD/NAD(P)-binding protein [Candidatus Sumerlaeaceae bacterium]|nr:FAD/NAD(P)-binding protein [Candidatus Sumerlaeaceae bacterium]